MSSSPSVRAITPITSCRRAPLERFGVDFEPLFDEPFERFPARPLCAAPGMPSVGEEAFVACDGRVAMACRQVGAALRREFERSVSRTSRALGISRTTVYRHLRGAG